ncbi:MAG: hypothetical protein KGD65_16735 [Candidatus Lokiarchaeota archaeon]|nr:hypothetical protein [Candidatus Lokiarchaeota archaeon]
MIILAELPRRKKTSSTGLPFFIFISRQERRTSSVPELRNLPISVMVTLLPSIMTSKREY